jgi:tetratricopeptide (TPR) repeat protein
MPQTIRLSKNPPVSANISAEVLSAARDLASGEIESAIATLERCLGDDSRSLPARFVLGLAAWRAGDHSGAIDQVRAVQEEAPRNGTYAEVLATLYAEAGKLQESLFFGKLSTALGVEDETAALLPGDFPSFGKAFLRMDDRPFARLANRLERQGRLAEAATYLDQQIRVLPDDAGIRARLIALLSRLDRAGEAVEHAMPFIADGTPAERSLAATVLTAVGRADIAAALHEDACRSAPDDAIIAARQIADASWLGMDAAQACTLAQEWSRRQGQRTLTERATDDKLHIGLVLAGTNYVEDVAQIADLARSFDRKNVIVHGFGFGELDWATNAFHRGAFDRWYNIAKIDTLTLTRIFDREGLDALVDAGGFGYPEGAVALARSGVGLRIGWLGNPGAGPYEYVVVPAGLESTGTKGLVAGPADCPIPIYREVPRERPSGQPLQIGVDARPCEMTDSFLVMLRHALDLVPGGVVLFRDRNVNHPAVVERLVAGFGEERAARIDVVAAPNSESFFSQVDITLAPIVDRTARQAVESLCHGVPVLVAAATSIGPAAGRNAALIRSVFPMGLAADAAALGAGIAELARQPERLAALRQAAGATGQALQQHRRSLAAAIEHAAAAARS